MDLGQGYTTRFGKVVSQMPLLYAAGERPISVEHALQKQYEDCRRTWTATSVITGDAAIKGLTGDVLIQLDSPLLLGVNYTSRFIPSHFPLDERRTLYYDALMVRA